MTAVSAAGEPRSGYADPQAVFDRANDWNDEVLQCRTYGHIWQPRGAVWNKRHAFYSISQQCPRCTSERTQEMSVTGHIYAQWITYAEGYLSQGLGRIVGESRDVIRLASVTRTFPITTLNAKESREQLPHSYAAREALGLNTEGDQ